MQHFDPSFSTFVTISTGSVAYSAPFEIQGSSGLSVTTQKSSGTTITGGKGFRIEYTDFGSMQPNGSRFPEQPINGVPITDAWYPWSAGTNAYVDGRYQDASTARWARLVYDDSSGGTSSGQISAKVTVRTYKGSTNR